MIGYMQICQYEPKDRAAVREICYATGDAGRPIEAFFPDRELFADLITRYYTDFEPGSSWVAREDGMVAGYLNGCLDTRQFQRMLAWKIVPAAVAGAWQRGTLFRAELGRLLWMNMGIGLRGLFRRQPALQGYPAHLHVNLRSGFRGRNIGHRLVECFLEQARRAGVSGVQAGVREDNAPAIRFLERLGFTRLGRFALFQTAPGNMLFTIVMGRMLADRPATSNAGR